MRGASRGVLEVGQVRRPLYRFASDAPGGPGSPSAGTKPRCLEWLDAARTKGGESCPDRGWAMPYRPRPEARPRGQKSRKWSAGWRARRPQGARRHKASGSWLRQPALHPLAFGRGTNAGARTGGLSLRAPPRLKKTGAMRLARNISVGESAGRQADRIPASAQQR
jgi:hypothetical protein